MWCIISDDKSFLPMTLSIIALYSSILPFSGVYTHLRPLFIPVLVFVREIFNLNSLLSGCFSQYALRAADIFARCSSLFGLPLKCSPCLRRVMPSFINLFRTVFRLKPISSAMDCNDRVWYWLIIHSSLGKLLNSKLHNIASFRCIIAIK